MLGFLRKLRHAPGADDGVTPGVTPEVTPVLTPHVTPEVAGSITPQRAITHWTEAKPFPALEAPPPGGKVQIWPAEHTPPRNPSAKDIAVELLAPMQRQPSC